MLVLLFVLIVAYAFMTSSTVIGRRIYAMGGNEKAAAAQILSRLGRKALTSDKPNQ